MSSHNVKISWNGSGKRSNRNRVANAKCGGASEIHSLTGAASGGAVYALRNTALRAWDSLNPQQQDRARYLAHTAAGAEAHQMPKAGATASDVAAASMSDGEGGVVSQGITDRFGDSVGEEIVIGSGASRGIYSTEEIIAFRCLIDAAGTVAARAFLLDRKRSSKLELLLYEEAARLNSGRVVRWTTKEEDARLSTTTQLLARGEALPGLMGKVAAELAAAAATARPVSSAAAAPKAKLPKRESYKALSLESKLWWQRRVFSQQRPKWTAAWWDLQGDHSLPEQARSHCYHMRAEAEDNLDHAKRYFPADVAAHAQLAEVAQRACDLEVLASRCPTVVAILQWGRGSLTHPAVAARKKAQQKKRRANGKERAAAEKAAAAAIRALPTYITALAPEAYMQPKEQIRSLNFKNLPLATNEAERSALGKALAKLVESAGASVSRERYALNIPTLKFGPAKGHTQGFGFVECTAAAGAQRVLATAGARGTLDLEFNGTTSQVFVELAAANRQSKADWEATKAKATAERAAAQAKTLALMKAAVGPKATPMELVTASPASPASEAPALPKVCLGASVKARREAEAAAETARIRAEWEAMFSAPLGGILHSKPKAPQFKLSFAGAAVKPAAPKVEVVDAFTAKVGGKLVKVAAAADTELGAAQAMMRKIMGEADAKAKKVARDKAYAQWLKDKAVADADPLGWGIEDWVEPE